MTMVLLEMLLMADVYLLIIVIRIGVGSLSRAAAGGLGLSHEKGGKLKQLKKLFQVRRHHFSVV